MRQERFHLQFGRIQPFLLVFVQSLGCRNAIWLHRLSTDPRAAMLGRLDGKRSAMTHSHGAECPHNTTSSQMEYSRVRGKQEQ